MSDGSGMSWPGSVFRTIRGEDGGIQEVGVAWWPGSGPDEPAFLYRYVDAHDPHGLVFRYQQGIERVRGADGRPRSIVFSVGGGLVGTGSETPEAAVTRRIRWALEAIGTVGPLFPLWDGEPRSKDPLVVAAERDGEDPEIHGLLGEVEEILVRRRTATRPMDDADRSRILPALEEVERKIGARHVGAYDEGARAIQLSLTIDGHGENVRLLVGDPDGLAGSVLHLLTRHPRKSWRDLWSDPSRWDRSGPKFVLVRRDALEDWIAAPERREPGHLDVDVEEAQMLRALGEPLPFAWPAEDLARWALEREHPWT